MRAQGLAAPSTTRNSVSGSSATSATSS